MAGIDETMTFKPIGIAVLTVSDTRTKDDDTSGDLLCERINAKGHILAERTIVTDDIEKVRAQINGWVARADIQAVITTGGTGLTGRDITPEALTPLFDKEIDGFSAVFHAVSFASIGTSTMQSRACAGIIGETLIFCLPGSNGAVKDGWDGVLNMQLDSRHKPCNFIEILPRLAER
ncbi:MAG: molybdenum cofactor biosynthesis protein B [Alphaproteobacteria bacterium]